MRSQGPDSVNISSKLIWVGVGIAISFWFIESAIHVAIFHHGSYQQQVISPEIHEIWMRLLVMAMFIAFAAYAQFIVNKCKKAEDAARLAHAELMQIFSTAADGMRVVDKDLNILRVNETYSKLTGTSNEEVVGKKCYEVFSGPSCHTPTCSLTRIMCGDTHIERDEIRERPDGTMVPCILTATPFRGFDGELVGIVEDFKDITDRKQVEVALQQSERRYRTLFNSVLDIICIHNLAGDILDFNQMMCERLGYSCQQLLGMKRRDVEAPEYADLYAERMKELKKSGQLIYETVEITQDGKRIPAEVNSRLIEYDGNTAVLNVARDITERKLAEEEKEKLQSQLQHAQKMESIGTLAGGIAHDFNNLLMGIQGNVSLMIYDMESEHPHYHRLKTIEKLVQSGAKLTSYFLGYARKGKYEIKAIDLNALLQETVDTFGRTRKKLIIYQDYAQNLLALEADPEQIEQVVLNLLVNAADAMPNGGNLVLKTRNISSMDMREKVYEPKQGDYILLTISDTGIGMDKETMSRIFDPFFTTKEIGRGTGLGLASVYGIMKAHDGYIDVDSIKGQGTTFSLYFPGVHKETAKKTAEDLDQFIRGNETILFVDDEEIIRIVGQDLLKALGYRVLIARDGQEAVDLYKNNLDNIAIVILDMIMPNIGGAETYQRLKEINPQIKVLLSSGYSLDGEAKEILAMGCNDFIQKPFRINELSKKIETILDKQCT